MEFSANVPDGMGPAFLKMQQLLSSGSEEGIRGLLALTAQQAGVGCVGFIAIQGRERRLYAPVPDARLDAIGAKLEGGVAAARVQFPGLVLLPLPDEEKPEGVMVWEHTGHSHPAAQAILLAASGYLLAMVRGCALERERRSLREHMETAQSAAQSATQIKTDFLSRMSHEIRTPINAIVGMTGIAKGSYDLEKIRQCLEKIDVSSKQLVGVINDVLDMSQLSSNKFALVCERFDFELMLRGVSEAASAQAGQKNQKLYVRIDQEISRYYLGDSARLAQVIANLLSNAVKFTPKEGRISVDVRTTPWMKNALAVQVRVTDTGIGIPAAHLRSIFSSFEQADGGTSRQFEGTGLGLAICQSIVRLMGGNIWAESEVGKGSSFTFAVPLTPASPPIGQEEFPSTAQALRVLLVDGEAEIRDYFAQIMQGLKIQVHTVRGDQEAQAALAQAQGEAKPFTIAFVDWSLAQDDGDMLRRIGQSCGGKVVAMLSPAQGGDAAQAALAAGASGTLSKPLFPSAIVDTLNQALGVPGGQDGAARCARNSYAGYTLLLVENAEINRDILCHHLSQTMLKIEHARDGRQALDMFRAAPEKYDLILMDVSMPVMNGLEATRAIRALNTPKARQVPIVAMTANAFAQDVKDCLDSGMNDHLSKPVDVERLLSKLNYYLTQYEPDPKPVSSAPEQSSPIEEEKRMPMENLSSYINVEEALGRIKGNKNLFKTLMRSFKATNPWEQMCAQVAEKDLENAAKTAHTIKGIAGNLSFTALYEAVVVVEAQFKSGFFYEDSFARLTDAIEKTNQAIAEVMETL